MAPYHKTQHGQIVLGDSLEHMATLKSRSVDPIVTSPPFGLLRKKDYGNVESGEYIEWFKPFGKEFKRLLKSSGSLVIDIGGAWLPGQPTRSLYHFELAIMLCRELGFYLAQEFFWWNPSKLPSPAEWVTVRRIRVKDPVNLVWWFSVTPWPKASTDASCATSGKGTASAVPPAPIKMRALAPEGFPAVHCETASRNRRSETFA
jgi:hypothetical protein